MFFLPIAVIYAITGIMSLSESHEGREGFEPEARGVAMAGVPGGGFHVRGEEAAEMAEHRKQLENPDFIAKLVLLHKGKGNVAVKILGYLFGAAMLLIYISGIWVGWCSPCRRKSMLIAGLIGLVVTVIVILVGSPGALPVRS